MTFRCASLMCSLVFVSSAAMAVDFQPAAGYEAGALWSGSNVAHFAPDGGNLFLYGTEPVAGGFRNTVRMYDGVSTTEIASSNVFGAAGYSPDAITAVGGEVYWAHVSGAAGGFAANLYRTSAEAGQWGTTTVVDETDGLSIFSLSTDGSRVFGTGLNASGENIAFFVDDSGAVQTFAEIPAMASGGSGFDPNGDFFAGAFGNDFQSHMYRFSAQQVVDRVDGVQSTPFGIGDAVAEVVVASNASAVMESNGDFLFGSNYTTDFSGTYPIAYDAVSGAGQSLGTLSGAATTVATDFYAVGGDAAYFLAKDNWSSGNGTIFHVVPEPTAGLLLLAGGLLLASRRRV